MQYISFSLLFAFLLLYEVVYWIISLSFFFVAIAVSESIASVLIG